MRDILRELATGPGVVDGLCVSRGQYCSCCNGLPLVNCKKSTEYRKR